MIGRPERRWMRIAASLIAGIGLRPCAAQSPAIESRPANPPPPAGGAAVLPSTVSPVIARFLQQSARDVPAPDRPATPSAPPETRGVPSPVPASPPSPAVVRRAEQEARSLPQPLPAAAPPNSEPAAGLVPPATASPLLNRVPLGPTPTEPTDLKFPINLATALRLSDARPLIVAAAQASVWVAEAELTQARALWLPGINLAVDYLRHDGGGPDFNKGIMTAPSVNFFYAGGGLTGFISLNDAYFEPLVRRQILNSRHWDIQSARNDALMRTADAYFQVHQHRGTYAGTLYCIRRGGELVEKVATLSRDMVSEYEVERARNMVADLQQRAVQARQRWRVSSADLTQVLRLDPRALIEPTEPDHLQISLVDPARPLEDLMPVAITNRPELASHRALVQAATAGIRREKMRPVIPMLILSGFQSPGGMLIQGGIFGLGPNSSLGQWTGRDDVSVQFIWQLEYFGFGNLARIKRQRGEQSQATTELFRAQDRVAADVARALARVQSAAQRVLQADRSLRTGIINLNGTFEGLGQTRRFANVLVLVNRPQEAVYSLQLLRIAFEEYYATVAEYNRAQFDLFHALGYPAQELTLRNTPGEVREVDLARPKFLPPVGNGPPPATR